MKRLFIEADGYNFVVFADDKEAYFIDGSRLGEGLTLDVAKSADYSYLDGCETARDCNFRMGENFEDVFDLDYLLAHVETVIEF